MWPEASPAPVGPTARARVEMVDLIASRGVTDPRVLEAMRAVPRHAFIPEDFRDAAYADRPLPIGEGQTISQPYMVAFMTQSALIAPGDRVLEVGTGSGYQAAILAHVGAEVYTVEIVPSLAARAEKTLQRLGIKNVHIRTGDGYAGWSQHAPFQAIVVTAAPPQVPPALYEQLAEGGRLVIPVGSLDEQWLEVHTRRNGGIAKQRVFQVRFVPMTGRAQDHSPKP